MAKLSVRLSPQAVKKLEQEAGLLSQLGGQTVTVSELIRSCIEEKFPQIGAKKLEESQALVNLVAEVSELKGHQAQLTREFQNLVHRLTELFPQLSTRAQVDELTDGIAAAIKTLRGV